MRALAGARLKPRATDRECDMAQTRALPGARFVDPQVLARIGNLDLLARNVVNGFINGLHRAPYFGASIDFAEHRGYVPGDDIRRVDWRLYARTDRYYVKQYEADTNTNFSMLLDVSRSMGFASRGVSELEFTYDDPSAFEDLESGEQIPIVPESLGDQYRTMIREHTSALATKFSEHRIDYTVLNTALPLDHALFSYLSSREKMMHVR